MVHNLYRLLPTMTDRHQHPAPPSATTKLRRHHSFRPQAEEQEATDISIPSSRPPPHAGGLPRSLQQQQQRRYEQEQETPKTEEEIDAEMAELQSEIDEMNAEEEELKKVEKEIGKVIEEEMQEIGDVLEEEENDESEDEGGDTAATAKKPGSPNGTSDEKKGEEQDAGDSSYLGDIESDLQLAQSACTKAKSSIPSGFELRTETAEELDAVNEGCCLGSYSADTDCRPAIPQVECDVHRVCAEAEELANKMTDWLRDNVDAAEQKCREGAAGILQDADGEGRGGEEPYDNVDDLNIIRMKCCLAPYDADLVECEDDATVATMRTENRCDLLEWCLEASRLEGQIDDGAQTSLGNIAAQNQDDDGYFTSPHVGGRDDDKMGGEEKKKTKFDKTKGLDSSKNPFGIADSGGGGSSSSEGSSSSGGGIWAGLTVVLLCCALVVLYVNKRSKQREKGSSGGGGAAGGEKDRRFTRRPMPSHNSHTWEDDDAEYGEHSHSDVGIGDDSSFSPALDGLFGTRSIS
mmetsp:Transcript_14775/g.32118  ORF Transcript_14775/g.32118 Transcript_14775/m.32118 type:complete len:520 (+) Transcript_14775:73-1632(+)